MAHEGPTKRAEQGVQRSFRQTDDHVVLHHGDGFASHGEVIRDLWKRRPHPRAITRMAQKACGRSLRCPGSVGMSSRVSLSNRRLVWGVRTPPHDVKTHGTSG